MQDLHRHKKTYRRRETGVVVVELRMMGDHRLPKKGQVGRVGERGETWVGGEVERMDGLRGRGSSAIYLA